MSQALEFFVGTLSIAKCIVILVVPLLVMYTCHQVHGKHFGSPRGKYTPQEPGKNYHKLLISFSLAPGIIFTQKSMEY